MSEKADNVSSEQGEPVHTVWRRWHLGALLAHLILTALFTWPLVMNFLPGSGTTVPGLMLEDRDQNLWNLWWVREALLSGNNPFVTDYIWNPEGVTLYYHTLNVFNGLLAVPLLGLFTLTTTYNLIVLFSFVIGGWGAFLLVHYLCGNRWAALVGSVIFAYSAYHIATMRNLLQMISLEWFPFFVLALLWAVYAPNWTGVRSTARWVIARALPAGVALLLISLVDWYYTLYALMLAGLLGLYQIARFALEKLKDGASDTRHDLIQPLVRIGACVAVWLLLASPLLVPTLRELGTQSYMVPSPDAALSNSADLLAFFQPTRDNQLWGHYFSRADWPFGNNLYEVYLTYTALLLGGAGLFSVRSSRVGSPLLPGEALASSRRRLPGVWFWGGSAILFFLLALGPVLQVGGQQVRWVVTPDLRVPMPYAFLERIPPFNISRSPDRFTMPLTLCLGVLAGYGTNKLALAWSSSGAERFSSRGAQIAMAATALMAVEIAPMPYPQQSADIPRWYQTLGEEAGDFTIFELPPQDDYWHGAFRMYNQTAHDKRIFGGYISREYQHPFVESTPGYMELVQLDDNGDMLVADRARQLSVLASYGTRYIVLQKDRLPDVAEPLVDVSAWRTPIARVLGNGAPIYEDEQLAAYRVPTVADRVPFLSIGQGWEPREVGPNGAFRWMVEVATLRIHSPSNADALLRFRATTIGHAKRLEMRHGDAVVFDETVGALSDYEITLSVPEGESNLTITNPTGTVSPAELGIGEDSRQLGFAFLEVELIAVDE